MKAKTFWAGFGVLVILIGSGVLIKEDGKMLHVGQEAPDFSAIVHTGDQFRLSDYRGKKNVVLYFYPKDFTAGCTEQACSFRDNYEDIKKYDAVIIGVSFDSPESHSRFAVERRLPYPLISDVEKSISKQYGAVWFSGLLWFPKRVTYVIDKQGIIRGVAHHEKNINLHLQDVRKTLEALH